MLKAITTVLAPQRLSPPTGAEATPPRVVTAAGPATADALRSETPNERFKALSAAHRTQTALVRQAQADAHGGPAAQEAFKAQTDALFQWTAQQSALPENKRFEEFFRSWLSQDAGLYLTARPLATPEARMQRYTSFEKAFQAERSEPHRALLAAAATDLDATRTHLAPGAGSSETRAVLQPALGHLRRSADPVARELARRIDEGELKLKVSKGGHLGIQYFAMMAVSGVTLSNGEVGPDFFALSPPYQAAVLRHEYTHVVQKRSVGGWLTLMASNLTQRFFSLLGRVPGLDDGAMDVRGQRWNRTEQEAYRAEKAFLVEQGVGDRGLLVSDGGMLDGVDTWLESGRGVGVHPQNPT